MICDDFELSARLEVLMKVLILERMEQDVLLLQAQVRVILAFLVLTFC